MTEKASYVYAYLRLDGETPCYIGKGTGDRWLHLSKTGGRNPHFVRLVQQAKALGTPLLRIKVAEGLSDQEALQLEADLIRLIGREANGGPLVNLTDGWDGPCGYKWTPEQIERVRPLRQGRRHSAESRAQTSASLKGRSKSPEHSANVSAALRGKKKAFGWWSTEEGRAKQRANNHGGRNMSAEVKEICRRAALRGHASETARRTVAVSGMWAHQNSVRYPQLTA